MKLNSLLTKRFDFINNLEKNNNDNSLLNRIISGVGEFLGTFDGKPSESYFWDMSLKNKFKFILYILLGIIGGMGIIVVTSFLVIRLFFQGNF